MTSASATVPLATVIRVGLATVQDGGRHGHADVGVPVAGALHRERHLQAAALIRGALDGTCPAVEVLHGDLVLRTHATTVACVVGPATWSIDGHAAPTMTAVRVPADAEVALVHHGPGPSYLAVSGWQPPLTLGSASTDTFSRLGGAVIASGFVLSGDVEAAVIPDAGSFHRDLPPIGGPLRVVDAGSPLIRDLADEPWRILDVSRSGVRMSGPRLPAVGTVPSAPMLPGAIQLTPSGEAIILGPDGGLTGGYPVAAVVATVDLDRVSLLAVGDVVTFRAVDVGDAARARAERLALLRRGLTRVHLLG